VEIAYRCGFANQAHLTLTFRKEFGVTPGEYRRQL
jgi:AraC-like DNA-binding protein